MTDLKSKYALCAIYRQLPSFLARNRKLMLNENVQLQLLRIAFPTMAMSYLRIKTCNDKNAFIIEKNYYGYVKILKKYFIKDFNYNLL